MQHNPEFLKLATSVKNTINECTIEDYRRWKLDGQSMVLVDVREDNEWEKGHIPDAIHIGKGVIERDIETLFPEKDTRLVLYCGGGFRSAIAVGNLQKMNYSNVTSMDGGFRRWVELSLEVTEP